MHLKQSVWRKRGGRADSCQERRFQTVMSYKKKRWYWTGGGEEGVQSFWKCVHEIIGRVIIEPNWAYRTYCTLYTDKKENKIFLIYTEIQMGSGAKAYTVWGRTSLYMRKCKIFSPYMRRSLVIYNFAPDPSEFPNIWKKLAFLFISVRCTHSAAIGFKPQIPPVILQLLCRGVF
jgi:hypothetical protein